MGQQGAVHQTRASHGRERQGILVQLMTSQQLFTLFEPKITDYIYHGRLSTRRQLLSLGPLVAVRDLVWVCKETRDTTCW